MSKSSKKKSAPIGIFDSGYGGLTVLREIVSTLPEYDYLYLGDNARTPYGTRSFSTIYDYTLQAVKYLFEQNCPLVILACNTASARALRNIQQKYLPNFAPENRVLGIIRPTAEVIGDYTKTGKVGILGTPGTVKSESYIIEIHNQFPNVEVHQKACPMWVSLVENGELNNAGTEYFVQDKIEELFAQDADIDTILLGCTHYPLLSSTIKKYTPKGVTILSQGKIVADSLKDYLMRHEEMEGLLSKGGKQFFLTTGNEEDFSKKTKVFYGRKVKAKTVYLK
jgi:glutamate racemase